MTTGVLTARVLIGVFGVLLLIGGFALLFVAGPFVAFWLLAGGAVLLIGVIIETSRYRSQAAERDKLAPGPGGGESGPLEPRFRPTDEKFVDPTTHVPMRVYIDSRTGERRYVAEA